MSTHIICLRGCEVLLISTCKMCVHEEIKKSIYPNTCLIYSHVITKTYLYNFDPLKPTIYVLSKNMKNIGFFFSENFHFLVDKFSVYLNRPISDL